MKEYTINDIKSIVRPQLGEGVPLALFRILRIIYALKRIDQILTVNLFPEACVLAVRLLFQFRPYRFIPFT
jgi:hypothetical protein